MKNYKDASYYEEGPVIKYLKRLLVSAVMGMTLSLLALFTALYTVNETVIAYVWSMLWLPPLVCGLLGIFFFETVTEGVARFIESVLEQD